MTNRAAQAVPYMWKRQGKSPRYGIALRAGGRFRVFIPYEEILTITDRMVDLYETHERRHPDGIPLETDQTET